MTDLKRTRMSDVGRKAHILEATLKVARREGLEATTVRAVAAEAGISHGLVLHHFGSMEELHSNLLNALLCKALVPQDKGIGALPVRDQLLTFLEQQLHYADQQRHLTDVLFEFWLRGARDTSIRDRIKAQLKVFREAIEPMTAALVASDPVRFRDTSARALATTIGDLVLGYEIQQQLHPEAGGHNALLVSVRALLQIRPTDGDR